MHSSNIVPTSSIPIFLISIKVSIAEVSEFPPYFFSSSLKFSKQQVPCLPVTIRRVIIKKDKEMANKHMKKYHCY